MDNMKIGVRIHRSLVEVKLLLFLYYMNEMRRDLVLRLFSQLISLAAVARLNALLDVAFERSYRERRSLSSVAEKRNTQLKSVSHTAGGIQFPHLSIINISYPSCQVWQVLFLLSGA